MAKRARRDRITAAFEEFHAAAGAALSAAARLREGIAHARAETIAEMWLRTDGIAAARADPGLQAVFANSRLAATVARVEADRAAAFDEWLATGPDRLAGLLDEVAPGSAGCDPVEWLGQVGKVDGSGPLPQLWRIGAGGVGAAGRGFPVGVPLLDESHLQITSTHATRAAAEALVEALLIRVVSYFRPGLVQVHVWDVGQFTGAMPGLYPLTRTGLLTVHDPGRLEHLLAELSDRIRRVHTRVLVDGHPSLRALAEVTGARSEPWVLAVLAGNRAAWKEEDHRQLQRVMRGGLACGIQLVLLDVPMTVGAPVESVRMRDDGTAVTSMTGPYVTLRPDPPLPGEAVTRACHAIADEHERWRTRVGTFADLLPPPEQRGRFSSVTGLHAPVGFADGIPVEMALADASPHALVGGPSGSGKTNLLLAMISSMAARYDPDELELYLLDFKEGVSFAQFAPGRRDTTWLPHARLIGVNINTDREFGLALLQFLAHEMRRRAEAAKAHEVTKLEELRSADPDGRWPRIVAVIDEFQYLFAERDAVTRQATQLLEDVARRGRSQGIHLVLASQDVSGIEAFWGRPAIFEQFVLRIALPRARRVLADLNATALDLPRWHAVLNHESGVPHGNEVVRIPDATGKGSVDEVQRALHESYAAGREQPRLFDGSRAPRLAELAVELRPGTDPPNALVGQRIDVAGSAAAVRLPAAPGRNLGVIGAGGPDAERVLGAAAGSLGLQYAPGAAGFVLVPLVAEAAGPAAALAGRLVEAGHAPETVGLDAVRARVEALAADVTSRRSSGERRPLHLVLYAADAADIVLDRAGTDALRQVLRFGPETGIHVLGWWRSAQRLRALLTMAASADDLGAWVGLDVQGSELGALAPGMLVSWSPRPGRALLFDRAQHARPEVVIVPSLEGP
ncbi:FtsK/SpoIIIE domain-containing protein [Pseudonocardia asaccharolytica]|uniref:Cell division protein FtsK n=1 Tax=Pseudonocardia asaccharolytica DSM 44247 = NBRC 16224 TaxID=1123024 RepID=A0A511D3V2_9PSEU|nr:FtsK/SpoIIIE domain-containing protein [Pseudonocardia asaccharolytica]GEL18274.1 cell division protein FtsK [Pseudonocardia asaccharolytica DSM 44247 = NBRC 16224]